MTDPTNDEYARLWRILQKWPAHHAMHMALGLSHHAMWRGNSGLMDAGMYDVAAGYHVYLIVSRGVMVDKLRAMAEALGRDMPVAGRIVKEGYQASPLVGGRDDGWRTAEMRMREIAAIIDQDEARTDSQKLQMIKEIVRGF